jgi:hypothetical protein
LAAYDRQSGICPRMPASFHHLDAILPRVGPEDVLCKHVTQLMLLELTAIRRSDAKSRFQEPCVINKNKALRG